jgi:hypothetical protein
MSQKSYSVANTSWNVDCLYTVRPYVRLTSFGTPPSATVVVDLLGLLEYTLSALNSVAGIDRILARMVREEYGTDNLEHDIAVLESALWFHQKGKAIEFEPTINSKRQPDYKVELGGQTTFVEVKILQLGAEADILDASVGELMTQMPSTGGKIKQRLLQALGVNNEKTRDFVETQVPLDQPSLLLLDLRFAAGLKDDVDALDAFLGQFDQSSGVRLGNGVIHHERGKNVSGMVLIDQMTVLYQKSGMIFIPNPLFGNPSIQKELDLLDVKPGS